MPSCNTGCESKMQLNIVTKQMKAMGVECCFVSYIAPCASWLPSRDLGEWPTLTVSVTGWQGPRGHPDGVSCGGGCSEKSACCSRSLLVCLRIAPAKKGRVPKANCAVIFADGTNLQHKSKFAFLEGLLSVFADSRLGRFSKNAGNNACIIRST